MIKQFLLAAAAVLFLSTASYAQTGGPVNIKATDTSTGASTEVGDNTNHAVRVHIVATDVASGGTSSTYGSAFPSSGTAAGYSDGTNMQGARVFDADSGAGTQYVLGVNLRIAGSGGSVEGGTASNPIRIDPTGTTTQPVSGTVTANAGTGTFATNMSQYNGSAVGASNAIHIQPGTGATFTVTQATGSNLHSVLDSGTLTSITNAVSTKPIDACGTTAYDGQSIVAATTLTSLTASTTCVDSVIITNTGSASLTALLQDAQGTPITFIPTTTIAPNASLMLNLGGMKFTSGIKYQLSASTGTVLIHGRQ